MAANVKQRYVPIKKSMVPKPVRALANMDKDKWWNEDRWIRVAHKNEAGVVLEYATVYGRRRNAALSKWFVADGTSPAPDRSIWATP